MYVFSTWNKIKVISASEVLHVAHVKMLSADKEKFPKL